MELVYAGLGLIALAWIIQLYYILRGNREIQPVFVGIYMVAVVLLVVGDILGNLILLSVFELSTLVAAGLVLVKLVIGK